MRVAVILAILAAATVQAGPVAIHSGSSVAASPLTDVSEKARCYFNATKELLEFVGNIPSSCLDLATWGPTLLWKVYLFPACVVDSVAALTILVPELYRQCS